MAKKKNDTGLIISPNTINQVPMNEVLERWKEKIALKNELTLKVKKAQKLVQQLSRKYHVSEGSRADAAEVRINKSEKKFDKDIEIIGEEITAGKIHIDRSSRFHDIFTKWFGKKFADKVALVEEYREYKQDFKPYTVDKEKSKAAVKELLEAHDVFMDLIDQLEVVKNGIADIDGYFDIFNKVAKLNQYSKSSKTLPLPPVEEDENEDNDDVDEEW